MLSRACHFFCRGKILGNNGNPDDVQIVQVLADSARSVTGREVVVVSDIVKDVVATNWDSEEIVIQVCRLGGNLCFDNPVGRKCVFEAEVLDKLSGVMNEKQKNYAPS